MLQATSQSGVPALALDVWVSYELRRAGFDPDRVWPRPVAPRVLPREVIDFVAALPARQRAELTERISVRGTGGAPSANILGKNYVKQVDVVMSSWATGPELMISTKRMDSSFGKNAANRVEESYGDAKNLRSRHPEAALGFLYGLGANALETEPEIARWLIDVENIARKKAGRVTRCRRARISSARGSCCRTTRWLRNITGRLPARRRRGKRRRRHENALGRGTRPAGGGLPGGRARHRARPQRRGRRREPPRGGQLFPVLPAAVRLRPRLSPSETSGRVSCRSHRDSVPPAPVVTPPRAGSGYTGRCLLYTSDAADDLPCVDLGGRSIIKKKKKHKTQHYNRT